MTPKLFKCLLVAAIAIFPLAAIALVSAGIALPRLFSMGTFLLVGMAVSANQLISRKQGCREAFPVAASTRIYEGTLVFLNVSGYADDDTASGANPFAGLAIKEADNSAGGAGDIKVEVWQEGTFLLTGTGFTQASVGQNAFATDNYTITAAPSASGVKIGRIEEYVSSTQVYVSIDVSGAGGSGTDTSRVVTKTADYTVTVADSGNTFSTAGAAGTVTFAMPAAVPGLKYRFRVGEAQELRIDPNGTETISLPSTGVPGAAGKYLAANAAGESVDLECVVAGTWTVFGYTGTWTAEA